MTIFQLYFRGPFVFFMNVSFFYVSQSGSKGYEKLLFWLQNMWNLDNYNEPLYDDEVLGTTSV